MLCCGDDITDRLPFQKEWLIWTFPSLSVQVLGFSLGFGTPPSPASCSHVWSPLEPPHPAHAFINHVLGDNAEGSASGPDLPLLQIPTPIISFHVQFSILWTSQLSQGRFSHFHPPNLSDCPRDPPSSSRETSRSHSPSPCLTPFNSASCGLTLCP